MAYETGNCGKLFPQPQACQHLLVPGPLSLPQVFQQSIAFADQHEQPAPAGMVFRVNLQMFRQIQNSRRHDRDLNLGAARICGASPIGPDDFVFLISCDRHLPPAAYGRIHQLVLNPTFISKCSIPAVNVSGAKRFSSGIPRPERARSWPDFAGRQVRDRQKQRRYRRKRRPRDRTRLACENQRACFTEHLPWEPVGDRRRPPGWWETPNRPSRVG